MTSSGHHSRKLWEEHTPVPDRYTLLTLVGRGGMALVHAAREQGPTGASRIVGIKQLQPRFRDDPMLRGMFRDEGRIALRLHHPNIVQTYDVGTADDVDYIVMEYLNGQPLSRLARSPRLLPQRLAARIVSEALAGLHHAHELCDFDGSKLHIVHRDCSPQNIFLSYDGSVKLIDFGVAKAALTSSPATRIGTIKGKLAYLAPEQANSRPLDGRADVFTIGIVAWELLTGSRLIGQCAPSLALRRLLYDPIPKLETHRPDIDRALARIVHRALERDPAQRWQSAAEMRGALEAYLDASGPQLRSEDVSREMNDRFSAQRDRLDARLNARLKTSSNDTTNPKHVPAPAHRVVKLVAARTPKPRPNLAATQTLEVPAMAKPPYPQPPNRPARPRAELSPAATGTALNGSATQITPPVGPEQAKELALAPPVPAPLVRVPLGPAPLVPMPLVPTPLEVPARLEGPTPLAPPRFDLAATVNLASSANPAAPMNFAGSIPRLDRIDPKSPALASVEVTLESEVRSPYTLSSADVAPPPVHDAIHLDVTQLDQGIVRQRVLRRRRMFTWATVGAFIWVGAWVLGRLVAQRDVVPDTVTVAATSPAVEAAITADPRARTAEPAALEAATLHDTPSVAESQRGESDSAPNASASDTLPVLDEKPARATRTRVFSERPPSRVVPARQMQHAARAVVGDRPPLGAARNDVPAVATATATTDKSTASERANEPKAPPKVTLLPPPPRAPLLD